VEGVRVRNLKARHLKTIAWTVAVVALILASAQAAPSSESWYYCPDSRTHFPYAQQCRSGWLQVVPSPGPTAPGPR
jgi:hypothetical protein